MCKLSGILRTATFALILVTHSGALLAQGTTVVGVCDIFADLDRWNGRMVELRGVIEPWGQYWISGRECGTKIKVGGLAFDNLIAFLNPSDADRLALHPVSFGWSLPSRRKLNEMAYYAMLLRRRIIATVVGLYETKLPIESLSSTRFPGQYSGFGDQGVGVAQIVIQDVRDIVLEPEQKPGPAPKK